MGFLGLLIDILQGLSKIIGWLYKYRTLYALTGALATRKFPATDKRYKYAVLIAARNESAVLGNLLESLRRQDYDGSVTVFTVADNCTDDTAAIARAGGAICYERFDPNRRTKGYALQYLVECIRRDYGIDHFDGYFVFDADNLLRPDYISRMNESFAAGEKIITSYRNTKNFGDNWISASYGLHWLRTIRTEHRARSIFRLATRIQGTGFLFASEVIRDGWNYTSLTEDRAFCADAVVGGYRISYNDAAEFFDEQPVDLKIAMRQRVRWSKGHLQAFGESGGKLFRGIFKAPFRRASFMSFDMLTVVFPRSLFSVFRKAVVWVARLTLLLAAGASFGAVAALIGGAVWATGKGYFSRVVSAVYIFIVERRRIPAMKWYKRVWFCLTFPLFYLIGKLSLVVALFARVEWKPIPHKVAVRIDELA